MTDDLLRDVPATGEVRLPSHLLKPRLRRNEASEYLLAQHGLQIAVATLAKFASLGGGPGFQSAVRTPLYSREELDRWALQRLGPVIRSTSEKKGNGK